VKEVVGERSLTTNANVEVAHDNKLEVVRGMSEMRDGCIEEVDQVCTNL
jgi:hypothetical protein